VGHIGPRILFVGLKMTGIMDGILEGLMVIDDRLGPSVLASIMGRNFQNNFKLIFDKI
jgi:hypothetical protein